jgi:hypothetical protein
MVIVQVSPREDVLDQDETGKGPIAHSHGHGAIQLDDW